MILYCIKTLNTLLKITLEKYWVFELTLCTFIKIGYCLKYFITLSILFILWNNLNNLIMIMNKLNIIIYVNFIKMVKISILSTN